MEADSGKCISSRESAGGKRAGFSDYLELTKPRLSLMSVITALFGFFIAPASKEFSLSTLLALFAGTALAAAGAAVLNQWLERKEDALMPRTADRPIPQGIINTREALSFGILLSMLGILCMALFTNALATILIILTLVLYLFVYTPMKKVTPWNTVIGAVPGALPPLIGWVSAEESFGPMGWLLFSILFAWQMPHFMAISWMYREDYIKGGYEMLSKRDSSGIRVANQALSYSAVLAALSLLPVVILDANVYYWLPALLLNSTMIYLSYVFLRSTEKTASARKLFFATLIFLPVYLAALVAGTQF